MSTLAAASRPAEAFDPANKRHRQVFNLFVRTGSWATSPIRLYSSEETMVDVGTMQRQLVSYYLTKEFNKQLDKPA